MSGEHRMNRRQFLKGAAAAAALAAGPAVIPASVLGGPGRPAPSDRITMGFIGIGNMGGGHLGGFLGNRGVRILAVCDVKQDVREKSKRRVDGAYSEEMKAGTYKGCRMYRDFRDILLRLPCDNGSAAGVSQP